MKQYLGVKLIEAEPLNLGDYNILRGWTIPENENPLREGYKVMYEDGYLSWSPKETFEDSYREIKTLDNLESTKWFKIGEIARPPHQERVISEMLELDKKIEDLDAFIIDNPLYKTLPKDEQSRLVLQTRAMSYYLSILVERVNNFK